MNKQIEEWLTVREAAQLIGRSDQFVRVAIRTGRFEAAKKGNALLLNLIQLQEFNENPFQLTRGEFRTLGSNG
jgi:excisionase family DNA binding protein